MMKNNREVDGLVEVRQVTKKKTDEVGKLKREIEKGNADRKAMATAIKESINNNIDLSNENKELKRELISMKRVTNVLLDDLEFYKKAAENAN